MFKAGVIFQPIPKEAIPPDVSKPDQPDRNSQGVMAPPADKDGDRRQEVGVPSVVEKCS